MRIIALDFNSVARQRVKINILRQFKFQQIVYASYITYSNSFFCAFSFVSSWHKRFCYNQNNFLNTPIRYFFDLKRKYHFRVVVVDK